VLLLLLLLLSFAELKVISSDSIKHTMVASGIAIQDFDIF